MIDTSLDKLEFRSDSKEDENFIYATWLNSYYFGSRFTEKIRKDIYYKHHQQVVQNIIESPKTEIIIACSPEDQNTIFGYIVIQEYEKPIIHYMYVKGPFQGFGISTELLTQSGLNLTDCYFTHWTYNCAWLIEKYPKLVYNPYLIS